MIAILEKTIARSPKHPSGGCISTSMPWKPPPRPGEAEKAADTLSTWCRGRATWCTAAPISIANRPLPYAAEANVRAAKVERDYIAQCNA